MAFKKVAKVIKKVVAPPKKDQRLVAERNVERMLADGYKIADSESIKDKHGRILGIKSHASDLVLMEKCGVVHHMVFHIMMGIPFQRIMKKLI